MGNWCFNYITVEGPSDEINRFKKTCLRDERIDFDRIIEMPDQFKVGGKDVWDETLGTDGLDARNAWAKENWGTTGIRDWQVDEDTPERYKFRVYTSWFPPLPVLEKLVKMFPALTFNICGGALASPPEWTYKVEIKDDQFLVWDTSAETWAQFEAEEAVKRERGEGSLEGFLEDAEAGRTSRRE